MALLFFELHEEVRDEEGHGVAEEGFAEEFHLLDVFNELDAVETLVEDVFQDLVLFLELFGSVSLFSAAVAEVLRLEERVHELQVLALQDRVSEYPLHVVETHHEIVVKFVYHLKVEHYRAGKPSHVRYELKE